MRSQCFAVGLLFLAFMTSSLQSPTPPASIYSNESTGDVSETDADEDYSQYATLKSSGKLIDGFTRTIDDNFTADVSAKRSIGFEQFQEVWLRRSVRFNKTVVDSTPVRAFMIADDEEQSVEEDSEETTADLTTKWTTTTMARARAPLPNSEVTQCINICKVTIDRSQNLKEMISCKHFMAFRDCLTKRCRPNNKGYAMVLRELQLAINEEICHIRDTAYSADRIAQCDAATSRMEKQLSAEWVRCNDLYQNAMSVTELCQTIKYCYLKVPLRYPSKCLYAQRFLKYFVLAEFTEASNGLLALKCPEIFPTADVDAYLSNQPYERYL